MIEESAGRGRPIAAAGSRVWRWLQRHWLAVCLPPAFFLLAAGVTQQLFWTFRGSRYSEWNDLYRSAMQAGMQGDAEKALQRMIAAAAVAPDDARLQADLARGFRQLGQDERALEHLELAVRLRSPDQAAYLGLVGAYCDAGRFGDAERLLGECGERLPGSLESADALFFQGLIHLYGESGGPGLEAALDSLKASLELDPQRVEARLMYGVCLARLGRLAEAEEAVRAVLEARPEYDAAYHELANVLRQQGRLEEARQALETFQARDARWQRIRYLETQISLEKFIPQDLLEIGGLYLEVQQPAQAASALQGYTKKEPAAPEGYRKLAEAYRRMGRREDAEAADTLAKALDPRAGGSAP